MVAAGSIVGVDRILPVDAALHEAAIETQESLAFRVTSSTTTAIANAGPGILGVIAA